MFKFNVSTSAILLLLLAPSIQADDWTRFRGHDGIGVSDGAALPASFSPDNVIWKTDLQESSSSPVMTDDALFVTTSDDDNLVIQRINAKTGAIEWSRNVERERTSKIHAQNDSASPTPVLDGENIYAFFQELGIVSFDQQGNHRWTLPLDPFKQFYSMSGSPVVTDELLLLPCDQQENAYLIAVNKNDGTIRWKADRAIRGSSWTTPVVYPSGADAHSVLLHGNGYIDAYALEDGNHLWGKGGFGAGPTTSPFLSGNQLFTTAAPSTDPDGSGFQMDTFEVLAGKHDKDGDGRITKEEMKGNVLQSHFGWGDLDKDGFIAKEEYDHIYEEFYSNDYGITALNLDPSHPEAEPDVLWQYRGPLPYITTPLLYRDILFFVDQKGHVNSVNALNGEPIKRERIPNLRGQFYASLIGGDGKVYVAALNGTIAVISAQGEWEVLSVSDLDDRVTATPAIGNGRVYIRTKSALTSYH